MVEGNRIVQKELDEYFLFCLINCNSGVDHSTTLCPVSVKIAFFSEMNFKFEYCAKLKKYVLNYKKTHFKQFGNPQVLHRCTRGK